MLGSPASIREAERLTTALVTYGCIFVQAEVILVCHAEGLKAGLGIVHRDGGIAPLRRTGGLCRLSLLEVPACLAPLVLDRAEAAERAVPTLAVVEDLDELEGGPLRQRTRWPRVAVDELFFQGCEPALGHGVVPALARSGKGLNDAVLLEKMAEGARGVCEPRSE